MDKTKYEQYVGTVPVRVTSEIGDIVDCTILDVGSNGLTVKTLEGVIMYLTILDDEKISVEPIVWEYATPDDIAYALGLAEKAKQCMYRLQCDLLSATMNDVYIAIYRRIYVIQKLRGIVMYHTKRKVDMNIYDLPALLEEVCKIAIHSDFFREIKGAPGIAENIWLPRNAIENKNMERLYVKLSHIECTGVTYIDARGESTERLIAKQVVEALPKNMEGFLSYVTSYDRVFLKGILLAMKDTPITDFREVGKLLMQ